MTRDESIAMAKEAGLFESEAEAEATINFTLRIERFAALVAAAEREACAKVCEEVGVFMANRYGDGAECITTGYECAAAIRSRG